MFDVIVSGGTLIDGSGAPRQRADVGIIDGRISAIGALGKSAHRVIDATGLVVAPGFIDIHTHYDAQILWDPLATPSNFHGVTSIIGGNCGFSIAPMAPEHVDYVTRMLAKVEGIPLAALQAGLDFGWRSFGEYLARLDGNLGINAGFLAGHSTLRRLVMAERATSATATDEDLVRMRALLRQSLADGALGFSSTWHVAHTDGDGHPVPSRLASAEELIALASEVGAFAGTMLEFTPGVYGEWGERETDVMIAMSLAARQPINWNPARVRETDPATVERQLLPGSLAAQQGARIVALFYPFPNSTELSLGSARIYESIPGWEEIMYLPLAERMHQFADPAVRRRLAQGALHATGPAQHAANWSAVRFERLFNPELQHLLGKTAGEVGAERGIGAFDAYLDVALADQLRTYVSFPVDAIDDESWRMRRDVLRDARAVLGGSDAGAHVDSICNANLSTRVLGELVRERGLISLEEAVRLMTDAPARFYGLRQRGRVAIGWHADLVVFDADAVAPSRMHLRNDFPAGAARLYAEADGIHHVLVNGVETVSGKQATGKHPGIVLRSGRDTGE